MEEGDEQSQLLSVCMEGEQRASVLGRFGWHSGRHDGSLFMVVRKSVDWCDCGTVRVCSVRVTCQLRKKCIGVKLASVV